MNDRLSDVAILAMFGGICVWNTVLSAAYLGMLLKLNKIQFVNDLFIDTLCEKITKALHNQDDHLYLDNLLNKYLDRNYELSMEEWKELAHRCEDILHDEARVSKIERSLAGILGAVCEHKLKAKYGKITTKSDEL